VATFLVVGLITLVFGQLATGALIATGLPPEAAAFQARSAMSGAGFTTTESESVVNHPVRRRIISRAMFVGTIGTPTLVVTVLMGLIAPGPGSTTVRALVVVVGVLLVALVVLNRPVRRWLATRGERYARRRLLPVIGGEREDRLHLGDGFVVAAVTVTDAPDLGPRSLRGLDAALPQVRVLGVRRSDRYIGEPPADLDLAGGDQLVVHARRESIEALAAGLTAGD
jgi:hypothetical protein